MARKKITIEDLAAMVGSGFRSVDKRFDGVDKRFEQVDKRFDGVDKRFEQVDKKLERVDGHLLHIDARLDTIEHDITEIRKHFVYRDEFEEVLSRLSVIEKKLGIRVQ